MFGFFGANTTKKLNKRYHSLLQEAMEAQRSGDIRRYSALSEEADLVLKDIDKAEKSEPVK